MSKFRQTEPVEKWEPTIEDANRLEQSLKQYEVKVINGKKQYPFEQWCADENIIRFLDNGTISIKSTFNWHRLNKTYALLKWKQDKELEDILERYPEERLAYENKLSSFFADVRSLFGKVKV